MDSVIAERVVVITGGSAGIGRAAVELFARNGARVVLAARGAHRGQEVAARLQAEGCHVLFVQADVSRPEDVQRLIGTMGSKASVVLTVRLTMLGVSAILGARQSIVRPSSTARPR